MSIIGSKTGNLLGLSLEISNISKKLTKSWIAVFNSESQRNIGLVYIVKAAET
jgi:hypothetical protein